MRPVRYKVLTGLLAYELQAAVEGALAAGWELQGGVTSLKEGGMWQWAQAVTHRLPEYTYANPYGETFIDRTGSNASD